MNYKKEIDDRGIKRSWIAAQLGVSKTMVTLFLKGERNLSEDKENKLRLLLK